MHIQEKLKLVELLQSKDDLRISAIRNSHIGGKKRFGTTTGDFLRDLAINKYHSPSGISRASAAISRNAFRAIQRRREGMFSK